MTMWFGQRSQAALWFTFALSIAVAAAFALPARSRAQDENASDSTLSRRVAVTSAVTVSAVALTIGGGLAAGFGRARRCSDHDDSLPAWIGCGIAGGTVLLGVTFGVLPVALTLGSYLPHHKLSGRGKWYAALAGAAVGIGAGFGVVNIPLAINDARGPMIAGTAAAALVASSIPVLALELSHKRQRRLAPERASTARRTQMMPVASALPQGGAWLGIAGTL